MAGAFRYVIPAVTLWTLACGRPTPEATTPTPPPPTDTSAASASAADDAGAPASNKKTLFVREVLADCTGEAPRKCMQIRESPNDDWTFLFSKIEGFTYEENYRYELRVAVKERHDAAADSSPQRYRLLEVVSKTKVTPAQ